MSGEDSASQSALARLRQEIADDRTATRDRAAEVRLVLDMWQQQLPAHPHLVVAAVALHAWYTGLEVIMERIARQLDQEIPTGETSHRDLLSQSMTEIAGLRPAVLPRELQQDLISLLAFRHFFRHAYAVNLEPAKLRLELERLLVVHPKVSSALDRFDAFLQDTMACLIADKIASPDAP